MTKAWTVSRGPITATELDVEKAAAINALLERPVGILPSAPGDHIRPFAIGMFDGLRALLKPGITATTLRRAIAAYVHSKRYYFASAQPDSMRHDIDGKSVEPISDEDRGLAQQRFGALRRRDGQQPATPAPEPVSPPPNKTDLIRAALLGRNRPSVS